MTFFSILVALIIEQLKPLRADNQVYGGIKGFAMRIEGWFNAGEQKNGQLGWLLMMAALMLPTWLVYWVFMHYNLVLLAFAWNVLIVYLTLGFRHYDGGAARSTIATRRSTSASSASAWARSFAPITRP